MIGMRLLRLRFHALETGAHAGLGIDEKLSRDHHGVAILYALADLDPIAGFFADLDLDRLKASAAEPQDHGIAAAGADERFARHHYFLFVDARSLDDDVGELVRLERGVRIAHQ